MTVRPYIRYGAQKEPAYRVRVRLVRVVKVADHDSKKNAKSELKIPFTGQAHDHELCARNSQSPAESGRRRDYSGKHINLKYAVISASYVAALPEHLSNHVHYAAASDVSEFLCSTDL